MPELPEVETLRRDLKAALLGRTITAVDILRRDVVKQGAGSRKPLRGVKPAHLLLGLVVDDIARHGKHLALVTPANCLEIHLGMSGQVLVSPQGQVQHGLTHVHARWKLDSGASIIYRDPRRFGYLRPWVDQPSLQAAWADLGPDALTIDGPTLSRRLGASKRPVKAALLDQGVLAGVGNIYADEGLFLARIDPKRLAGSLKESESSRLAKAIQTVLESSLELGGSTLRDYRRASGQTGQAQTRHWVYGRGGQACLRCGATLAQGQIGQRTSVWCPACQGP